MNKREYINNDTLKLQELYRSAAYLLYLKLYYDISK